MSDEEHTAPTAAPAPVLVPGLHGQVSAFNPHQEDWVEYVERLQFYFMANDINDATNLRFYLTPPAYRLVKTLAIPGKPTDLNFAEIVEKVKNHFTLKPSPIIKRFEFNTRKQKANETVSEYVAALLSVTGVEVNTTPQSVGLESMTATIVKRKAIWQQSVRQRQRKLHSKLIEWRLPPQSKGGSTTCIT